jgi:DNA-binding Xre family transcriptional regulator
MAFLRVQELAKQKGLNITTLSRKAELAYTTASALWHDRVEGVSRKTLESLADALDVDIPELFARQRDTEDR